MATSEIEKLERRYAENPHGLTFAPLAEVHRKNGDFARALELLTAGLELHPNYIPASIVLGRCHQDLGDLPSAEAAFAHVLRLDDENVIALKSLADINERLERYAEAEGWLRRLVAVDRSNEEAGEQLRRVEAAKESQAASLVSAEPPAPAPVLEMIDLSPEAAEATAEGENPVPEPPVAIETPDMSREEVAEPEPPSETRTDPVSIAEPEPQPEPALEPATAEMAAPLGVEEPAPEEGTLHPLPGLISAEFQPPLEATGGLGVETSEEVVLEPSDDSEFRVPDASEDFKSLAERLASHAETAPPKPPKTSYPERGVTQLPKDPEFVLTESMAEALVRAGESADALRVYRELVRRNGGDPRFASRIMELETALAEQPAKPQSYNARDTKGQSVAALFHALLSAGLSSDTDTGDRPATRATTAGAPADTDTDAVGASYGEGSSLAPPAIPSGEQSHAAVSFDDFFKSASGGSTAVPPDNSEPGKDDLDQFQSWLQNLKR